MDEVVWVDLCDLLAHPVQVRAALERAHGGEWLPQEMQARQAGLRRAQNSLAQQLDRLTDAYLGGVIALEEYRRRRADIEQRCQAIEVQQQQLESQVDRRKELAGLACSAEDFCVRVRQGLEQASFEQKRQLVELLIDRVIVTNSEVEIRYVVPTSPAGEKTSFCHLRTLYRTGSSRNQATLLPHARLWGFPLRAALLFHLRRNSTILSSASPTQTVCLPCSPKTVICCPSPSSASQFPHLLIKASLSRVLFTLNIRWYAASPDSFGLTGS